MTIKLTIDNPPEGTYVAISLIKKMATINKLKFDLEIVFDYIMGDCGTYYPTKYPNKIFINPDLCSPADIVEHENEPYYVGYSRDITEFGITIHEFCHFASYKIFKGIVKDYKHTFPTTRLYLNTYSDNELEDELAESMTLYTVNPLLLKLISPEHWKFYKKYFKSPVATSVKQMFQIYDKFPIEVKHDLETRWKIVYDVDKEIFVKTV